MNETLKFVIWALATLVAAFVGSFLGGYLKRKGENLATHEDIDKLVAQVSAVTQATKEIEAKISDEVWDRQKRWELKREALFEATKQAASVEHALVEVYAACRTHKESVEKGGPELLEQKLRAFERWNEARNRLDQATWLVRLACGEEIHRALLLFAAFAGELVGEITQGRPDALTDLAEKELVAKSNAVTAAVRKELGTN